MNYLFNEDTDRSLKERICEINNIEPEDLDVSDFFVDEDIDVLIKFREKINEYRDLRFLIVGDYDCDGICATVIIKRLLNDLGIQNNHYIPSRSKEGYGLNTGIVDKARDNGFGVIFCVDNGVVAKDELKLAHEYGIRTLIIDHHEYEDIPECDAFLHPALFEHKYSDMCAGGLSALLSNSFRNDDLTTVYGGLATLADMVSVFGYNRYLIMKMMNILNKETILPIRYLAGNRLDYETLSFNVIPKINAVSRMEEMLNVNYVVRYLLENDESCQQYLSKIEEINKTRKQLGNEMYALAMRKADVLQNVVVVSSDVFKEGLCGMIANRMMNEINKPVIILTNIDGELKGSARSPAGSNLYEYLKKIEKIFTSFGGHAQAVGLSLKEDDYDELLSYIDENEFDYPEQSKNVLIIDQDDVNEKLIYELDELKPFGVDFIEPLFAIKNIRYESRFMVAQKYPKFRINSSFEAISFNSSNMNAKFDTMIGRIRKDDYHKDKLSMIIEDLIEF